MTLPTVDRANISDKRVFVRADIDIPLDHGKITDDTRLRDSWPTIKYLLDLNCTVVLAGHLGRPEGRVVPELSSKPVAQWLGERIKYNVSSIKGDEKTEKVVLTQEISGFVVSPKLTVLENLRFDPKEEANNPDFARQLADLADVYVNESFASIEREHASVVGVPKFLPHYAGFRLAKEVKVLTGILEEPQRPLVVIIGGAKLETKVPVIAKMFEHAEQLILGGKILTEDLGRYKDDSKLKLLQLTADAKDTTLESIDKVADVIARASTIIWNGPLGAIEDINYQVGTKRLVELIITNQAAYKVVGGGDTIGFLNKIGLTNKFNWVSSGGGSMLKLLSDEELVGIAALLK